MPKWVKTKEDYAKWKRGEGHTGATPAPSEPAWFRKPATMRLDCQACKSEQSMTPTKIYRMSGVVVFIGHIIVIPSLIGAVMGAFLFFSTLSAGEEVGAVGATIVGISIMFGIASLVFGIIGWLLIMKKKVFKCISCGFLLDRH